MVYSRVGTRAVKAVKRIRKLYTTVGVSTSATLPAAIESARHEQGVGCGQTIRCHTITNLTGTSLNQSAATVRYDTFSDLVNDVTISCRGKTFTMASMLDNTQTPPVYVNRTYAQFQTAGGTVSASTINAGSVANTQVFVPRGWSVWTDEGPDVGALTPYFTGLEQETPIATVTGVTIPVDGTIVVACSVTDKIRAGDVGTIVNGATNTTANGTWQITSVVQDVSITMTGTTATTAGGLVTGTPLIRFAYPTHCFNSQVTFNPLGDYQKSGTTRLDVMGNGDWTSVGASTLVDGSFGPGFAMIIGTDPTGGENVHLTGDSIAFGKGDNVTNDPAADQAGDAAGNMGFYQRALYRERIPSIRSAVPSESTVSEATKFDNQFRLYFAHFGDVNLTNHGHNTVFSHATYAPFKTMQVAHFDVLRAAGRGRKAVVGNTLNALAAQLLSDKWKHRDGTNQNQAGSAPFVYPGGYVYNNYHVDLAGPLVTGATGGLDGVINIAQFDSNIFGVVAIDGYKAVDGVTDYGATIDGTHNSTTGNINIAALITRPVLIAAKVVLS